MCRTRWAGTVMFAALLALAGCGGPAPAGPGPSRGPGRSPAVATSTPAQAPASTAVDRPAPSPVQLPAAARAHTRAGAEAFARFYYASVGDGFASSDAAAIEAMALPTCVGCGAFARHIHALRQRGQRTEESSLVIKFVSTRSGEGDHFMVNVAGEERPVRVIDAHGAVVETSLRGVFTAATDVVWVRGQWHIKDFKVL